MYSAFSRRLGGELAAASGKEAEYAKWRRQGLKRVDREPSRGNFKAALFLVKQLQSKPAGGLRGFGAAKQVPKRLSSLDELELDWKELLTVHALFDSVMESIESCNLFDSLDEVADARKQKEDIGQVGSWGSRDFELFMCNIRRQVAEHLVFRRSEGHYSYINMLDQVFQWLGYNKSEASSQVKWAALNTVLISHHYIQVRSRLAEAMALEGSIGSCIDTIDNTQSRELM